MIKNEKLELALKKDYLILHDDLTMFYNDSNQDTPEDAEADAQNVNKDFKLILPIVHVLHHDKVDNIDLAYSDFLDAKNNDVSLPSDSIDFNADMNNAINNVPVK